MTAYDRTHRTETFKLESNPYLFAHLCGPDPRKQTDSPLIICVHGFPELGFSWRYQWSTLTSLGYSVCSPDMRGYGKTWVPPKEAIREYTFEQVSNDLLQLIKVLNRKKAIFIGHDIGGAVVWSMGLHHQEACLGLIVLNTPLVIAPAAPEIVATGGPVSFLRTLDPKLCGHFDYQAYFLDSGDDELNENPERTMNAYFRGQISGDREKDKANMRLGMRTNLCRIKISDADSTKVRGVLSQCPQQIPRDPLWSEEEIKIYAKSFERTGFPLSWYRAFDTNWKRDVQNAVKTVNVPCLMITAEFDAVLSPESSKGMEQRIPDLERKHVVCGHWSMIERKDEINAILNDFLLRRLSSSSKVAAARL